MNILQILLIAAILAVVIVRRFAGQPVRAQSVVLPLGIAAWGLVQLRGAHPGPTDLAFVAAQAVFALAVGAARAATIRLYLRDGQLWQRYHWSTLVVWLAAIAMRFGFAVAGQLTGVHVVASSLLFVLGLSLVAEAALVGYRARATGAPLAPPRRRVRLTR